MSNEAFDLLSKDDQNLVMRLADQVLDRLSPLDIVSVSPMDYGSEVTEDHKNYTWSALVDLISSLSFQDWEDMQETMEVASDDQEEMLAHLVHYIKLGNTSFEDHAD